jgi:hypothetical protein
MLYDTASDQDSGWSLHSGSTVWDPDIAALHHMPIMPVNQNDAFGSAKQMPQL